LQRNIDAVFNTNICELVIMTEEVIPLKVYLESNEMMDVNAENSILHISFKIRFFQCSEVFNKCLFYLNQKSGDVYQITCLEANEIALGSLRMNGDESGDSGCIVPKRISLPYVEESITVRLDAF